MMGISAISTTDWTPIYFFVKEAGVMVGCARLLPTTGDYMIRDHFPHLVDGAPACCHHVWELTRFAVITDGQFRLGAIHPATAGLLSAIGEYALRHKIQCLDSVVFNAVERLMKRTGLPISRLGGACRVDGKSCLAVRIMINDGYMDVVNKWRDCHAVAA